MDRLPMEPEIIVERYYDMIFRLAAHYLNDRHSAQDIVQTVFLKYLDTNPVLISENHEKAWFLRVAINACKNYKVQSWKTRVVFLPEAELIADNMNDSELEVFSEIQQLPENQRTAVYLYYYVGLKTDEIAEMMNSRPSTVMSWLHRARKNLKSALEEVI